MNVFGLQTELVEIIRAAIRTRGPQSFAWFMKQALYHPERGYYSSGRAAIGRKGDYFTSVSVGPLFGQLLAAQFIEIWQRLGQPADFVIVEQGAHDGAFARDTLGALRDRAPDCFSVLRYRIIEPFDILKNQQQLTLVDFRDKVDWRDSIDALEPFTGIHFSNELLDAMPVHLVSALEDRWMEKCVGLDGDEFVFVQRPIVDSGLRTATEKLPARSAGYETEINLVALDWIKDISAKLSRGFVLIADYGFPENEFYATQRTTGTLQMRAHHRRLSSPFEEIGHADITAHVEWTSIAACARSAGLRVHGFCDQHHFLTGIISAFPELAEDPQSKRALQTLLHPEMLGRGLQILALEKNVEATPSLSGFKFARDARAVLGY